MINWYKIEAYENNKYRSFEELCYQIAKELYRKKGRFTRIDDSGGGDGIEFYMTLPNDDEWGWQAKFYHPAPRLSKSNRKQSIRESLEKACEVHPNLKKWILCTPTNFTTEEQKWFENTLPQSIPKNMDVKLQHWGDSDFNAWLSKPSFSGKRNYFFGELELDINWFKTQFDKQAAAVGEKFDSSLHTETKVDVYVHALLGDKEFAHHIGEWIEKLEGELPDLKDAIKDLKRPIPNEIEWSKKEKSKVIESAELLRDALVDTISKFGQAREFLNEKRLPETQAIGFGFARLQEAFDSYRKTVTRSGILKKVKYTGENGDEERVLREAAWIVNHPDSLIANLLDDFYFSSARHQSELINEPNLNIFGKAGTGKTHIACNICENRLKGGLPALFIRGSLFTSDRPIEEQLLNILDIPSSYSWSDFLQALSAVAEAYHTRIPLIIDGFNESTHNGVFSDVWGLYLNGFVQEIAQTKNIVLITTCRTSYREAIWGQEEPSNTVNAYGFNSDEVEQAVKNHFKAYKITANLTGESLEQFKHPIYLKIFCETKNPTRETEKHIYVGDRTLFEVFEEYLVLCNQAVCKRLRRRSGTSIVQPALNKVAEYLWKHSTRHIPLKEFVHIIDGQSLEDLNWWSSKTHAVEAEGLLLIYRDWIKDTEMMGFTYDLLGGYLIAKYLIQQAAEDLRGFLRQGDTVALLFGEDHQAWHPMHEDISRCLAALLPSETGQFLHKLSENKNAFGLSIRALFEISPRDINEECINLVTHLFDQYQENRNWFLKLSETTVGHFGHPFNASFWSKRLSAMSMVERDLDWSEHIRLNRESFEEKLTYFEEICQTDQDLSNISVKRLHLLAEHIMWILTSTVRPLRDQATRALYWYGRRFPQEFFKLAIKSFSIDDPYVSERMLAATYGIAMARQYDFEDTSFSNEILPLYGKKLYEAMFKPNAPHSTTHVLARDYARRTIDIAIIHHPNLLTEDERERITPPFTDGGIREWGESEDRNKNEYHDGNAPLQLDFMNYTLGRLVKDRRNYDSEHDGYKRVVANIFWRIYDLGYSLENFGKIDKWLAQVNMRYGRSADGRKTDRYGKKYSWIAFYELAGLRQDQGLLSDFYDDVRILDADIDPSFPDEEFRYNLIKEDFLGDREVPTKEWISKSPPPDLTLYLKIDTLCGEQGPWVLLQGRLGQEDKQYNRNIFAFLRGLIVNSKESTEIVEALKKQKEVNRNTIASVPEDHFTYAGEIPWCDTYQENGWEEVSFEIGSVLVPKEPPVFLRNGEPISDTELYEFWDSIMDFVEEEDLEEIEAQLNERLQPAQSGVAHILEEIEAQLNERGLELTIETIEIEQPEHRTFNMLVPVRDNSWSDSQSAVVPDRSVETPSKQIAKTLDLCGQPQSFDFFEKKNGRRASITFRYGEKWGEMQYFTYLREDLLQRYLKDIDGELIWVIWGEQSHPSQNPGAPYKLFQDVKIYPR